MNNIKNANTKLISLLCSAFDAPVDGLQIVATDNQTVPTPALEMSAGSTTAIVIEHIVHLVGERQ